MAGNNKYKAGLIPGNQGGMQAPLGDTCMDTDKENGNRKTTNLVGVEKGVGIDPSHWNSWREIQILDAQDGENLGMMKKEIFKMLGRTRQQKNVSMVIKDGLEALVEIYDSLSANLKKKSSLREVLKTEVEQVTRRSPRKERKVKTRKRPRTEVRDDGSSSSMEFESDLTDSAAHSGAALKRASCKGSVTQPGTSKADAHIEHGAYSIGKAKDVHSEWKEVRKKGRIKKQTEKLPEATAKEATKKKKDRNKRRPEALVIKVSSTLSYADILKKLRDGVKPEDTGTEIHTIRKTAKGDVLLELSRASAMTKEFQEAVEGAIGDSNAVTGLAPRSSIEIRDLDDLTTEAEVKARLEDELKGSGGDIRVFLTNPNSRSQRLAVVELAEKGVDLLMKTAKIRIGCVNCRIRRRVQVFRCFKCMGYGHKARECKGVDRSHLCFKCGKGGHKGESCKGKAKCMLCTELDVEAEHISGRKGCTAFGQALEQARRKMKW